MQGMKTVIPAGPGLVAAASALGSARRRTGVYSYQWLFPGPNSRHVRRDGSALLQDYGTASELLNFTVPEGMRFVLKGIVYASGSPDWVIGSGDLLFSLVVTGIGARDVDYLANVAVPMGSLTSPWPITGRLEFTSLTALSVTVTPVDNVTLGAGGGYQTAVLVGYLYPNSEAGEG